VPPQLPLPCRRPALVLLKVSARNFKLGFFLLSALPQQASDANLHMLWQALI